MPKKEFTIANDLLFAITAAVGKMMELSPYALRDKILFGKNYNTYRNTVYNIRKKGLVKIVTKDGKKFLKLTKKGELEVLLAKARMPTKEKWDGKWRLVMFDIPEEAKRQRDKLRDLLKRNNFFKFQESVYVSPYPFNREAIKYLQETKLIRYIRILKVEEMDNDSALRKRFAV